MHIIPSIFRARTQAGNGFEIKLKGHCMEPFLFAGDSVFITSETNPQIGDIALIALDEGNLALHRIVSVTPNGFITKGDYSGKAETVSSTNLIGIAEKFSLEGGPWVKEQRCRKELEDLSKLSILLSSKTNNNQTAEVRTLLWSFNETARNAMLEEASSHHE